PRCQPIRRGVAHHRTLSRRAMASRRRYRPQVVARGTTFRGPADRPAALGTRVATTIARAIRCARVASAGPQPWRGDVGAHGLRRRSWDRLPRGSGTAGDRGEVTTKSLEPTPWAATKGRPFGQPRVGSAGQAFELPGGHAPVARWTPPPPSRDRAPP